MIGLKKRLADPGPIIGAVVSSPEASLIEMIAYAGFDYVQFDAEHGPLSLTALEGMIVRADAAGIPALVRVPSASPDIVQPVLDAGATGLQVPRINTAEDARRAVDAAHFHPLGTRGISMGRASGFGVSMTLPEHVERGLARTVVMAQLEDALALERIDETLAVPGIDAWFVGPSDLSQSLGFPGRVKESAVQDAIEHLVKACGRAGVRAATTATSVDDAARAFERGFTMVSVVALGLFGRSAKSFVDAVREESAA